MKAFAAVAACIGFAAAAPLVARQNAEGQFLLAANVTADSCLGTYSGLSPNYISFPGCGDSGQDAPFQFQITPNGFLQVTNNSYIAYQQTGEGAGNVVNIYPDGETPANESWIPLQCTLIATGYLECNANGNTQFLLSYGGAYSFLSLGTAADESNSGPGGNTAISVTAYPY